MADLPARFGPYEIVGQLGAGGMGEVYRARDARLQRSVAIKILSHAGALDPDRQRRFAREAVAASALNHPNILTVYDVGVEGAIPYLVSELIDGESLRTEMNRSRMPLKRVLEIAHQIAEGLAAAHENGIVHCDLKPENVMLTDAGRVKIVDFGLAKAQADEEALGQTTQTATGLVIGTVPYMSPEQARGAALDFRSDQFALGVMLYEMTTATHPFKRETAVQTLSAIITDDPPDLAQVNSSLPVAVRWLTRRLLAKDPRERYAHTADLAADLRNIREHLAEATSGVAPTVSASRSRWMVPAAAATFAAVVVFVLGAVLASDEPPVTFERFTPFATEAAYQGAPAWSPDGKTIAYEAEINGVVQIFTRPLESTLRTQVTNSMFDCYAPEWSPDGHHIYYHSIAREKDALWRVSPAGGSPELVIEGATRSAVSPDGKTLAVLRKESALTMKLWIASPPDSEPRVYSEGAIKNLVLVGGLLRFSPDGSTLMAWLWNQTNTNPSFWEIPTSGGEPREVLHSMTGPGQVPPLFSWMPDNRHIVVMRAEGPMPGTHLWVADTKTDLVRPITTTVGNEGAPDVSPDGRTIAFSSEATDFDLVEVPLDGSALRPFLSSTRNEFDPAASPVNTQFAFVTDRYGHQEIWLQNEEGYLQQPLVTEAAFGGVNSTAVGSLTFSPDGKRLAFQWALPATSQAPGGSRLWVSSISGGTPLPVGGDEFYQDAPTWSPDGEWLAYLVRRGSELLLVKARIGGGSAAVVLKSGVLPFVSRPQWSPDGQWILCETSEGLALIASDGGASRVIADPGWLAYAWSADARRVYGLRPTDDGHHFMFVSLDARTGAEHVINENLGTIPQANQPIRGFSRLHDHGFLTSIARVRSDIYLIEGFRLPWPGGSACGRQDARGKEILNIF